MAPEWANRQLVDVITAEELGEPIKTLEEYRRIFLALSYESTLRSGSRPGIFATFGERSDSQTRGTSD